MIFEFLSVEQKIDQEHSGEKALSILVELSLKECNHQMTQSPPLYLFTVSKAVVLAACSH